MIEEYSMTLYRSTPSRRNYLRIYKPDKGNDSCCQCEKQKGDLRVCSHLRASDFICVQWWCWF